MENYIVDDEAFTAFLNKVADDKEKGNRKSSSNYEASYEEMKWVGLENDSAKIVRIVGAPPESMTPGRKSSDTDSVEIYVSRIMNDANKKVVLKLPPHADDFKDEHIMWRIINKVKEVEWVPGANGKNEKKYKYAGYPWYDKVIHGGFNPTDQQYSWTKGWSGQQVVIFNVIDREDSWCKDNKHTKLLSKRVNQVVQDDGSIVEYADTGVPSYGFLTKLSELVGKYGSWEKYDIAITKTGEMTSPYVVKNATAFAKCPEDIARAELGDKLEFVSQEVQLTPEELSYERYNIKNNFKVTSYQKLLSDFGNTIKSIDGDLRTTYYDELKALADKEKAEYEAKKAEDVQVETSSEDTPAEPISESIEKPTRNRVVALALAAEQIAALKGWDSLTEEERKLIKDVELNDDGSVKAITYTTTDDLADCPVCKFEAPMAISTCCPVCGLKF